LTPVAGDGKKLKHKMLAEIMKKEREQNPALRENQAAGSAEGNTARGTDLKAFAEGRIKLENKKIVAEGKALDQPYCLNAEIEVAINQ